MDACKAQAGGCSAQEQKDITASWAAISAQQNAQLANCDATGDCAEIGKEVMAGTQTMLSLLDHLPIGGAPGTDLGQTMGQNLANNATYRARVEDANVCQFDPNCGQGALTAMTIATLPIVPGTTAVKLAAGGVSSVVNIIAQMATNGWNFSAVNKTDAAMAGVAGTLTYGASFETTVLVSVGTSLWGSAIKNSSEMDANQGALFSGAFSILGYGVGSGFSLVAKNAGYDLSQFSGLLGTLVGKNFWGDLSQIFDLAGSAVGSSASETGAATFNKIIEPKK